MASTDPGRGICCSVAGSMSSKTFGGFTFATFGSAGALAAFGVAARGTVGFASVVPAVGAPGVDTGATYPTASAGRFGSGLSLPMCWQCPIPIVLEALCCIQWLVHP